MEKAVGRVTRIADDGATVSVDVGAGCARCAAGRGCGAALLAGPDRKVEIRLELPAGSGLREGDRIALTISPRHLLRGAFLAYGLPLAGLLVAAGLLRAVAGDVPDWQAILAAAGGLGAGIASSRRILGNERICRRFVPEYAGTGAGNRG